MEIEIIPALMPDSLEDVESAALSIRHVTSVMQIDVMDGKYVHAISWPCTVGVQSVNTTDFAFPLWEDLDYELDLMVTHPENDLKKWLSFGASRVIFHYASVHDWTDIAQLDEVERSFVSVGVAVTIHDPLKEIVKLVEEGTVDFVQFMGISEVGLQGEPFAPEILDMIRELRARFQELPLSIDGGVSPETIAALDEAGINRFVSGSYVFGHGIPEENVEELRGLIE